MNAFYPVLHRCPLFADIRPSDLPALLSCLGAQLRTYPKNAPILSAGDPARCIGVVLEGSAHVLRLDYQGNRTIVGSAGPAEVFGETFAFARAEALPVSVVAESSCTALLMDGSRITSTCSNACGCHHQLICNLLRELAAKNLCFHQKLEITSKRTTREKLLAYLNSVAQQQNSRSFEIPFDRQALADYLEVDRSGLSVQIGRLAKEGVLRTNRRHFELL